MSDHDPEDERLASERGCERCGRGNIIAGLCSDCAEHAENPPPTSATPPSSHARARSTDELSKLSHAALVLELHAREVEVRFYEVERQQLAAMRWPGETLPVAHTQALLTLHAEAWSDGRAAVLRRLREVREMLDWDPPPLDLIRRMLTEHD